MSNSRVIQGATIVSATGVGGTRILQGAIIVSALQLPVARVMQGVVIVSVSPGKPIRFSPVDVRCKGPLTLAEDMPAAGKR